MLQLSTSTTLHEPSKSPLTSPVCLNCSKNTLSVTQFDSASPPFLAPVWPSMEPLDSLGPSSDEKGLDFPCHKLEPFPLNVLHSNSNKPQ